MDNRKPTHYEDYGDGTGALVFNDGSKSLRVSIEHILEYNVDNYSEIGKVLKAKKVRIHE